MQIELKNELHNIISGKSQVRFGAIIQTIASYLSNGKESSPKTQDSKQIREQETKRLITFVSDNKLWINDIDFTQYISEGGKTDDIDPLVPIVIDPLVPNQIDPLF